MTSALFQIAIPSVMKLYASHRPRSHRYQKHPFPVPCNKEDLAGFNGCNVQRFIGYTGVAG